MNNQYMFPATGPSSNTAENETANALVGNNEHIATGQLPEHQICIPESSEVSNNTQAFMFSHTSNTRAGLNSNTTESHDFITKPMLSVHPSNRTIDFGIPANLSQKANITAAEVSNFDIPNFKSQEQEASMNNKDFDGPPSSYNFLNAQTQAQAQTQADSQPLHIQMPPNSSTVPQSFPDHEPVLSSTNDSIENDFAHGVRKQLATDWKQPSEYALHILFTKFVRYAEVMLNHCLRFPQDQEPPIVDILGEGCNEDFDKVVDSLGYISRSNLKPVIDAMMFWRKSKSQAAVETSAKLEIVTREYEVLYQKAYTSAVGGLNSNTTSITSNLQRKSSSNGSKGHQAPLPNLKLKREILPLQKEMENQREIAFNADRKSLISIYILSRVLIEICKQCIPNENNLALSSKLEEIVFNQIRATDPQVVSLSMIRSVNWNSFAELLGWISDKNFISVSDRFLAALEKIPHNLSRDLELRTHLLILGMRYLRLKNYPLERFEEGADFVNSIAKFFSKSTNTTVRLAYAEVLTQLLLPLAGSLSAEVNHPIWVDAMQTILSTCNKLKQESGCWSSIFKLTVAVLCVSPQELFSTQWMDLVDKNCVKLKSKSIEERTNFAVGVSRLVWVYLFRCTESLNNTEKSLKKISLLFLSTKKKEVWLTTDTILSNAMVDILVSVSYNHKNLVIENIILPLLKSGYTGSLENLHYEKLLIVINAYKGLLLSRERPEFPIAENREYAMNLNNISVSSSIPNFMDHEEICSLFNKLFLGLDSVMGSEVWSPENEHLKTPSTPFQHIPALFKNASLNSSNNANDLTGYFNFHNNSSSNEANAKNIKLLNRLLFSSLIDVIPCCTVVSQRLSLKSTIEILSRNAVHDDLMISNSSEAALKSLARKKNPYTLITWFAKYSFDFDENTQSSYDVAYLSSPEYKKLLILYIGILECWLESFKESTIESKKKEMGLDGIHLPIKEEDGIDDDKVTITEELECKDTCTVIEEVEGNGLFFLCSYDSSIRQLASYILELVSKFDEALSVKSIKIEKTHTRTSSSKLFAESGSRLIDILKNCEYSKLISADALNKFSAAEKQRLAKLNNKHKSGVLLKIADSDYGVDAALWMRVFPRLLDAIFKTCPITMALCRSIVCIRLVQLHDTILGIASNNSFPENLNLQPENLASQWKLYLIVACSFLTSTNDQTVHITNVQNHNRQRSQQVFTVQHQKIKSATSIFKMVLPLLGTKNTFIRDGIITGLSAVNINIYKAFLECVERLLCSWKFESGSNTARIELFHILTTCSSFLEEPLIFEDQWIMKTISHFLQNVKTFLHEERVQYSLTYQPLRLYFSELLLKFYNSIINLPEVMDKLFPFEARTSCFNYLMEWCGHGEYASLCKKRYNTMIHSYSSSRDYTSIASSIEFYRTKLEKSSLETMVELCKGSVVHILENLTEDNHSIKISFNISGLLHWINVLFLTPDVRIKNYGCAALSNLLETNKSDKVLYESVLQQCFFHSVTLDVTELYYTTICKSLLKDKNSKLIIDEDDAVTLGLFGVISKKREIRAYAIDLLSTVEMEKHHSSYTKVFKERISNDSMTVYKATGKEISNIFAELPSQEQRLTLFSKLCLVLDLLSYDLKGDLLVLLFPWVNKFVLKSPDDVDTYMILNNTLAITAMCNDHFPVQVEQLWISLGKGNSFQNFHVVLDFILKASYSNRNPRFIEMCRDVVLYLSNVPGGTSIAEVLLGYLDIKNTLPNTKVLFNEPPNYYAKYGKLIDINQKLPYSGKDVYLSKVHVSTILLVNLLNLSNEAVESKVPLLLHICLIFLDHYIPIVQESASKILCDLVYALNPSHEKSETTVALIKNKTDLWAYNQLVKDKKGARSPQAMDLIIKNILVIIADKTLVQEHWQKTACRWATLCAVRHIACRSFQVFRSLITSLDLKMLKEMLHRLSNTICDDNVDIQGFSMQILMTFNAVTAELSPERLIEFPQMFWALAACLSTTHEQEFIEVLSSMNKFVSKIDLDSVDTVQCLVATFPSEWEGKFDGLQRIVMTGLRSSNAYDASLKFLNKLNTLKDSKIIANSETRVLFSLLSNIPNFLQSMDNKDLVKDVVSDCDSLISLCDRYNEPALSRLVNSMKLSKFRSKKDFISQVTSFISRNYFPDQAGPTLVFLLGLLFNNTDYVRFQVLEFVKYLFPLVDLNRPEFVGVGADLISPLLSLLLTKFEHQALEVINCVSQISGSQIDKDILRISMGNTEIKKEYNKTATLFGIPDDESGWSIPMPVITASSTRHNVQSVYATCHIKVNVKKRAAQNLSPSANDTELDNEKIQTPTVVDANTNNLAGLQINTSQTTGESADSPGLNSSVGPTEDETREASLSLLMNDTIKEEEDEYDEDEDDEDFKILNSNGAGLYNIEEYVNEENSSEEELDTDIDERNIGTDDDIEGGNVAGDGFTSAGFRGISFKAHNNLIDDVEEDKRMMILYEYQTSPHIYLNKNDENEDVYDDSEVMNEREKDVSKKSSSKNGFLFSYGNHHHDDTERENDLRNSGKKEKRNKEKKTKSKEVKPKKRSYHINGLLSHHHHQHNLSNDDNQRDSSLSNSINTKGSYENRDNALERSRRSVGDFNTTNETYDFDKRNILDEDVDNISSAQTETQSFVNARNTLSSPVATSSSLKPSINLPFSKNLRKNNTNTNSIDNKTLLKSDTSLASKGYRNRAFFSYDEEEKYKKDDLIVKDSDNDEDDQDIDDDHGEDTKSADSRDYSDAKFNLSVISPNKNSSSTLSGNKSSTAKSSFSRGSMIFQTPRNSSIALGGLLHSTSMGSMVGDKKDQSLSGTTSSAKVNTSSWTSPVKNNNNNGKNNLKSPTGNKYLSPGINLTKRTPPSNSIYDAARNGSFQNLQNSNGNMQRNSSNHNKNGIIGSRSITPDFKTANGINSTLLGMENNNNNNSSKRGSSNDVHSGTINKSVLNSPLQFQLQDSVSLSHMWTELDNLDNFFTQSNNSTSFWST